MLTLLDGKKKRNSYIFFFSLKKYKLNRKIKKKKMGNMCSAPQIDVSEEQIQEIKELIFSNEHFSNLRYAISFLVPDIAKKNNNDVDKTFNVFISDKRPLKSIADCPDKLQEVAKLSNHSLRKLSHPRSKRNSPRVFLQR
jgi:hypothetical protein